VQFVVNGASTTLAVPGAAWILGNYSTTYSWQGSNYTNGPWRNASGAGLLAAQFGVLGSSPGGVGSFSAPTAGNLSAFVAPYGQAFVPATTLEFGANISQSLESAKNLSWTAGHPGQWHFSNRPGANGQGVLSVEPTSATRQYNVSVTENGLPTGTAWQVALTGGSTFSTSTGVIHFALSNGSYPYTVSTSDHGYRPSVPTSTFNIGGLPLNVSVTFQVVPAAVTFLASGLAVGTSWSVTLGASVNSSSGAMISFTEPPGTYAFEIGPVPGFETSPRQGTVSVAGAPVAIQVPFAPVLFTITFSASGLPSGATWSVTLAGTTSSSGGPTIEFEEPNGTYAYSVLAPSGYVAHPPSNAVTVNGSSVSVEVPLASGSSTSGVAPFGLSWPDLTIILLGGVAVGVIAAVVATRRRRRPPVDPAGAPYPPSV
jgi:hypothetical protein